ALLGRSAVRRLLANLRGELVEVDKLAAVKDADQRRERAKRAGDVGGVDADRGERSHVGGREARGGPRLRSALLVRRFGGGLLGFVEAGGCRCGLFLGGRLFRRRGLLFGRLFLGGVLFCCLLLRGVLFR